MPSDTVLGFDTSGAWCTAAIVRGETLVAARHHDMQRGQGEALMPVLDEVLAEAGIGWADLDAIGVGTGPGNFTGTRIAVAAARGLALGLGIPAIGVDRFDASALGRPGVVVAVPAPRGQVWVRAPGGTPTLADTAPEAAIFDPVRPPVHPLAEAIARIAAARLAAARRSGSVTGLARPAPLYLRGADAAPPSDPPPALID